MDLNLAGRGALVIGATGGMGGAIADLLAAEGVARLALGVRDRQAGEAIAERLTAPPGPAVAVVDCDLGDPQGPTRCVAQAQEALGPVDIIVAAAGEPARGGLFDVDEVDIAASLDTKLLGTVRLLRAALPPMRERGWGRAVVIGGLNGRNPKPGAVTGGIANAGLANLVTAVAKDVGGDGVTVNLVDPHFTKTGRWDRLIARTREAHGVTEEEATERILSGVPSRAPVPPEHVAAVVGLLVSEAGGSLNGCAIPVDGGAAAGLY